jgi:hypothetical protein
MGNWIIGGEGIVEVTRKCHIHFKNPRGLAFYMAGHHTTCSGTSIETGTGDLLYILAFPA